MSPTLELAIDLIRRPSVTPEDAGCQACMNLGCPAILWSEDLFEGRHRVQIDPSTCIGCSLCVQVCPTDCIRPGTD